MRGRLWALPAVRARGTPFAVDFCVRKRRYAHAFELRALRPVCFPARWVRASVAVIATIVIQKTIKKHLPTSIVETVDRKSTFLSVRSHMAQVCSVRT